MVTLFNQAWSKAEILSRVGHIEQLAGISLSEAGEGKARGSRILNIWTGTGLHFQVNADRALDISSCDFKGIPLSWRSPSGDVHPAYYEPQESGWLRSFPGGLLTTCGLDHFGPPSQDGGVDFGLHGRISNTPASQVNHRTYWEGGEYKLEITAESRQVTLFGENLVLRRRISSALGSNSIRLEDCVSNEGFKPTPHMLLYHFNLGFPLVSEKARLHLQTEETLPRDELSQSGIGEWNRFQAPTPGYQEQVFIHRPETDENGFTRFEWHNPQLEIGLRWSYNSANLPYLMEWKMMGEGAYVVGIEPANCNGVAGRLALHEEAGLPLLKAGENREYQIDVEIFTL